MKLVVKAYINGVHEEVAKFDCSDIAMIKHRSTGFDLIMVGGAINQYDEQCILVFI